MNKLKRYVGLAAALLLLVPAFIKVNLGGSVEQFFSPLTPFGVNVPTAVVFATHPARCFWVPATLRVQATARWKQLDSHRDSFDLRQHMLRGCGGIRDFVAARQSEFDEFQPGLVELLDGYSATTASRQVLLEGRAQASKAWEALSNLNREEQSALAMKKAGIETGWFAASAAKERTEAEQRWAKAERTWTEAQRAADLLLGVHAPSKERRAGDLVSARIYNNWPSVFDEAYDSRLSELESRIVPAINGYLAAQMPLLAGLILAVHLLLLFTVVLVAWKRDRVGAAILWPVTAPVGAGKEGVKAAKRLHEKV